MITVHLLTNLQFKRKPLKISMAQQPAVRITCKRFHSQKWCWLAPVSSPVAESFRQCLHTASSCSLGFSQHSRNFQRKKYPELWRKRQTKLNILFVPATKVTQVLLSCLKQLHRFTQVQGGGEDDPHPKWRPAYGNRAGRACRIGWRSLGRLWERQPQWPTCPVHSLFLCPNRALPLSETLDLWPLFCLLLSEFREHYRLQSC